MKKFVLTALIFSLIITFSIPNISYAGGSGGEPLMSDGVGWGLVGVVVVVLGLSIFYLKKQEVTSEKNIYSKKSEDLDQVKTDKPIIVTQHGNLIIAKW